MNRSRFSGGDMKCFGLVVESLVEPRWQNVSADPSLRLSSTKTSMRHFPLETIVAALCRL